MSLDYGDLGKGWGAYPAGQEDNKKLRRYRIDFSNNCHVYAESEDDAMDIAVKHFDAQRGMTISSKLSELTEGL